jgi:putative endonuclease
MQSNSKKSNNKETGSIGEELAATFLTRKGYQILERNFVAGKVEIDIVAKNGNDVVFVEVKTRLNAVVEPEKAVTKSKQKNMAMAAEQFIIEKQLNLPVRFDIISINFIDNKPEITHFEDAFYPFITL